MDSPIIVTGGAGAIGSQLVKRLVHDEFAPTVIDNLSSGHKWLLPKDVSVLERDVADIEQESTFGLSGGTVFHLAAFFANQNSVENPELDLRTNGNGTLALLRWAAETNAKKVIYASAGCSIVGHKAVGSIEEVEQATLHMDTPYQITKALGEFYCCYFHEQVGLPTVRCRFFNSYGPGEVPGRYRNVIPNWIWAALHGKPLVITGTGDETRDFIYVDDLVDGLVKAANSPNADGQAFNLGTEIEVHIGDLAEWILKATDSNSKIVHAARRTWDRSMRRCASIAKARQVLGFEPQTYIHDGLEKTVDWFLRNKQQIYKSAGGLA
ncbi:MAG: hypothetical protein UY96_C0013G0006 [Parcubacteria group bacterium GW2011_GWB1_56_8]|nr:MAG: hypothetical protein UY96_C0013G0006 [Parcubacteria group bacterium GW2011_GWB1_56_8]